MLEILLFVIAGLSLGLAAYVFYIGHNILTAKTGFEVDPYLLGYLYHLLKIYEYLDIILSVLAGDTVISKYTAFSHLFLPVWSYFRIMKPRSDAFDWRLQVIADCSFRFLSRAIPWLMEDVKVEQILLSMFEEGRWYADLVISAFWALFTLQGQRESEQAIKIFGQPYKDEITAHFLSAAIMLYAGQAKRQEDAIKAEARKNKEQRKQDEKTVGWPQSSSTSIHHDIRQSTRRKR